MQKISLFIFFWALSFQFSFAQKSSCCSMASTDAFATFASDKAFMDKHEAPVAYTYKGQGEMVSFATPDGKQGKAFLIKNQKPTNNYIFVIHEWWGLNDNIKKEAERLFSELGNVNVIALDLYDEKIATKAEDASQYMQAVKKERAEAIIKGAITFVGKKAKIGTVGWCFGGGWSLQTALMAGKQTKACVVYYGMPEKDINRLKTLKSDVLGIFAAKETWITPQIVKEFEENMKKAGKKLTVKNFEADHAFANPSSPRYNEQAAQEANKIVLEYFKRIMK